MMGTVLFVHGAGIRFPGDREMFEQIEGALQRYRPDLTVDACSWGAHLGSRLHAGGASIPHAGDKTSATTAFDALVTQEMPDIWTHLQQDPFYELATLVRAGKDNPSQNTAEEAARQTVFTRRRMQRSETRTEPSWQELDTRLHALTIPLTLQIKLAQAGIAEHFANASTTFFDAPLYQKAIQSIASFEDYTKFTAVFARMWLALAYQQHNQEPDLQQRDEIFALLRVEIARCLHGETHHSPGQWQQFARSLFTPALQERQRKVLIDMFMPFIGDIVLYQSRGEQLRDLILEHIHHVSPPVTLLAHSLGGVACVDILVQQHLPQVQALITAGSQVPLLYEMDALQSLTFGQPLPPHFPTWLNIYDMRDILSYIGEDLFPGRIHDVRVNNKHIYPQAHNTYWTNPETWHALLPYLPPIPQQEEML